MTDLECDTAHQSECRHPPLVLTFCDILFLGGLFVCISWVAYRRPLSGEMTDVNLLLYKLSSDRARTNDVYQ